MTGNALTAEQVGAWEAQFGPLEPAERELLLHGPRSILEHQQRQVLLMFMQPMECPACQRGVPARQALGKPAGHSPAQQHGYTCPHCHRGLLNTVPVPGPDRWRLAEPLGPAAADGTDAGAAHGKVRMYLARLGDVTPGQAAEYAAAGLAPEAALLPLLPEREAARYQAADEGERARLRCHHGPLIVTAGEAGADATLYPAGHGTPPRLEVAGARIPLETAEALAAALTAAIGVARSAQALAGRGPDPEASAAECGRALTLGPQHDPYGTACDQAKGHYPETDHAGPHPLGSGPGDRITWRGGGYCAGDALPHEITSDSLRHEITGDTGKHDRRQPQRTEIDFSR